MDKDTKKITIACTGAKNMPLAEFKALQGNLKTISPDNLQILKNRIIKYGFDAPIFVWGKYILDGHQRLVAIQSLIDDGYSIPNGQLPVCEIKAKNMADAKKRLLGYISQFGHIEADGLDTFVDGLDLQEISKEVDLPGFILDSLSEPDIEDADDVEAKLDEAEELQQKWLVNDGDIWQCGKHRILCGDSTQEELFKRLMGDQMAGMTLTDPPYNVNYVGKGKDKLEFDNESMDDEQFHAFLLAAFQNMCQYMQPGASFYVFHSDIQVVNFRTALCESGMTPRQGLVWNKSQLIPGRQDYQWKHEPILYGWKEGAAHYWAADRKQTTVLEFDKPTVNSKHPTMKPVDLLVYLIKNSSRKGDIVIDPFLGSGSSLIACEDTNRICYGIELSPKYVAVTLQRYLDLTGSEPERLNES